MRRFLLKESLTYGDNGRSIATFYTMDIEILKEMVDLGWSYETVEQGFWLRAPDVWLVDITEPKKVLYYSNALFNLSYFNFLKDLLDRNQLSNFIQSIICRKAIYYKGFDFVISTGPALEAEIRLIGSDKRVKNLKFDILNQYVNDKCYNDYLSNAKNLLGESRELDVSYIKLLEQHVSVRKYFENLHQIFSVLNISNVYNPIINKCVFEDSIEYDIILFIPTGCFDYVSSFITKENINKVMFWEVHANRHVKRNCKCFTKQMSKKRVLIVDKSYSGKTLGIISELIKSEGGEPIRLGLYPKSKYVLLKTDYVMILDRIFKSSELDSNSNDWLIKKYINILNGGGLL